MSLCWSSGRRGAALVVSVAFWALGALGALGPLGACVSRPPVEGAERPAPAPDAAPERPRTPQGPAPEPAPAPAPEPAPEPEAPPPEPPPLPETYLAFTGACGDPDAPEPEPGPGPENTPETVTLAAVGDVLLHHELQIQAFAAADRHRNLWRSIEDLLGQADLTYANLEGPMAAGITRSGDDIGDPGEVFDRVVYTAYPRFNFHPSLALDLRRAGFDVVSTANNHARDRLGIGVDRTIDALRAAGLPFTGTRRSDQPEAPWHTVIRRRGLAIAFLACTDLLNVRPDESGQVLRCRDRGLPALVRRLAGSRQIDAVIVTPHWGKEYSPEPRSREIELAHRLADAGATAILGSHPHVLQPWERYTAADGREVLIHYSLGNFVSHQPELPRRSTLILYLGLAKGTDGITRIRGVRYLPLHVRQDGERFFVEAIDRVLSQETGSEAPEEGPTEGLAAARRLIVDLYGEANLLGPDEPLDVAPHCDPRWRPSGRSIAVIDGGLSSTSGGGPARQ